MVLEEDPRCMAPVIGYPKTATHQTGMCSCHILKAAQIFSRFGTDAYIYCGLKNSPLKLFSVLRFPFFVTKNKNRNAGIIFIFSVKVISEIRWDEYDVPRISVHRDSSFPVSFLLQLALYCIYLYFCITCLSFYPPVITVFIFMHLADGSIQSGSRYILSMSVYSGYGTRDLSI